MTRNRLSGWSGRRAYQAWPPAVWRCAEDTGPLVGTEAAAAGSAAGSGRHQDGTGVWVAASTRPAAEKLRATRNPAAAGPRGLDESRQPAACTPGIVSARQWKAQLAQVACVLLSAAGVASMASGLCALRVSEAAEARGMRRSGTPFGLAARRASLGDSASLS